MFLVFEERANPLHMSRTLLHGLIVKPKVITDVIGNASFRQTPDLDGFVVAS